MLPRIQPIAPKRIQVPFDHADFVYEIKMDGWRCLTYIDIRTTARRQIVPSHMSAGLWRNRWQIQKRHLHGGTDFMGKNLESFV